MRTASLVTLALALVVAGVGCDAKKSEARKDDVPITSSDGTDANTKTKGRSKAIEAGIEYPPKK